QPLSLLCGLDARIETRNFDDTLHILQLVDELLQVAGVINIQHDLALENAGVCLHGHRTHIHLQLLRNHLRHIVDQPHTVSPANLQPREKRHLVLRRPTCLDDAVTMLREKFRRVGAVRTVDLNPLIDGDETENIVTRNRRTTLCQPVVYNIHIVADEQDVPVSVADLIAIRLRNARIHSRTTRGRLIVAKALDIRGRYDPVTYAVIQIEIRRRAEKLPHAFQNTLRRFKLELPQLTDHNIFSV